MKKTIFIITLCTALLLMGQQKIQVQEKIVQTNDSEILTQQKTNHEINLFNKDILENTRRIITNENNISNLFITKIGVQGLLLTLLLSFLSIFGINKIFKEKTSKKIKELKEEFQNSIDNVKEAEIRTIQHIKNAEIENEKLRGKSQILLVNEVSTAINKDLELIFKKGSSKVQFNCTQVNIRELTYKKIKNELVNQKGPDPTDFDLIIFDNSSAEGRQWNTPHIDDNLISLSKELLGKEIGILYYSNDQFFPSRHSEYNNIPNKHLLTYANVVPNLYSNAMTVLKLKNLYE